MTGPCECYTQDRTDQGIGKRSESVGTGSIRDVRRPPCRSTVTHAGSASPHVADARAPAGRRSQVVGFGSQGAQTKLGTRETGGRPNQVFGDCAACERQKEKGKRLLLPKSTLLPAPPPSCCRRSWWGARVEDTGGVGLVARSDDNVFA